jgi:TfoX/Sxy family transcriptional regulator of competence genes
LADEGAVGKKKEDSPMPYNRNIAKRIQRIVASWEHTEEKKMFGGICHLLRGNMVCGVYKDFLILRLGEDAARRALTQPFVKAFDITGKPMKGWVMMAEEGFADDGRLSAWLEQAKAFAEALPAKR